MRRNALLLVLLGAGCKSETAAEPAADAGTPPGFAVTTSRYDNLRTGANTHETVLTPGAVTPDGFGLLLYINYDGNP
jgi:hypothetical protein